MTIVVDESVSYGVVRHLREFGHNVLAIAEPSTSGIADADVFEIVKKENAVLITRDNHFTNNFRFPARLTACIIFIRKGNLSSKEEIDLINWFFSSYNISDFEGHLISISKDQVRIRK